MSEEKSQQPEFEKDIRGMESSDESSSEEDRVNQYVFKQESENETSKDASELKEETQSGAEMKQEAKPRSDSKMEEKKPDGRPEVVTDEQLEKGKKKKQAKEKEKKVALYRLFTYADGWDRLLLFFGTIGSGLSGCLVPALMFLQGNTIQTFNDPFESKSDRQSQINNFVIAFTILGVIAALGLFFAHFCWATSARRQAQRVRANYFKAVMRQDVGWYDLQKVGSLSSRIEGETIAFQSAIGEKMSLLIQYVVMTVACLVVAFVKQWKLTLVIIAFNPLSIVVGGAMISYVMKYTKASMEAYGGAGTIASDSISGIRTVTSFSSQERQTNIFDQVLMLSTKLAVKKRLAFALGVAGFSGLMFISYGVGLYYGSVLIADAESIGGNVIIVFNCAFMAGIGFFHMSTSLEVIGKAQAVAHIIFETIDRIPPIDSYSDKGFKPDNVVGKIELSHVDFNYPARPEISVLKDFNLSISPGQVIALVGISGSGKSSVISLLQRFYDPKSGSITIDDYDLKDLNLKWYRSQIGLVGQEPVLFSGTIADNIRWGKPDATDDEVFAAAKAADAHNFISEFPDGYNTQVGEKGTQLSGGQKQRVAIARAIIKNPKILLLDEATSALDTQSEAIVQKALDSVMKGRTTIVIAHRLSTIRNADRIIVMDKGAVVEQGTHEQLMQLKGHYFTMVQVQGEAKKKKTVVEERMSEKIVEHSKSTSELLESGATEKVHGGFFRILGLAKPYAFYVFLGIIAVTTEALLWVAQAYLMVYMVNNFFSASNIKQNALTYMIGFFILAVISFFAAMANRFFFGITGEKITHRLRVACMKAILRHDISWFDYPKNNTGAMTSVLSNDCPPLEALIYAVIGIGSKSLVGVIAGIVVAFISTWKVAIVVVWCYPLVIFTYGMVAYTNRRYVSQSADTLSTSNQLAYESIGNIRTVASFTGEERIRQRYITLLNDKSSQVVKRTLTFATLVSLANLALSWTYALAFWRGGSLIVDGEINFKQFLLCFLVLITTSMTIGFEIVDHLDALNATSAAARVFRLMDYKPIIDPITDEGDSLHDCQGTIELRNVSFAYPTRPDVTVLNKISLTANPRNVIALVGYSGCGKSSIIQLLERFYDPNEGNVLLDGRDIRDLNPKWLRSQIGLVGQEPVLFTGTIADNIRWGKPDATDDEVFAAAKAANAHNFISEFPDGYNTQVGEKGTQLSGGQKQRVAIARAIIKNPKILLLDEATSALDTESEKIVQKALDSVMKGRTTIVIAHRLSTIRDADQILVMDKGTIVEQGTFDELMEKKDKFYALVQRQT